MPQGKWVSGNRAPYTPKGVRARKSGLRPSFERLVAALDTADPIFPMIVATLRDMARAGVELDERTLDIAIRLARQEAASTNKRRALAAASYEQYGLSRRTRRDQGSIVYYIRRAELIKIGRTTRPVKRFEALLPDEILAFEPGGAEIEVKRHHQFLHARKGASEYFHQTPDLMEHIAAIRSCHGEPDPSWPTTQRIGATRSPASVTVPPSLGLATAGEAAAELGVKKNTFYSWVRRGKIQPFDRDPDGRPLFWLGDVWRLKQQSRAYRETA